MDLTTEMSDCISEQLQAAQRSDAVDEKGSDGEEGEPQPEAESATNTRDEVDRLHHVVLVLHCDPPADLYGEETWAGGPAALRHQAQLRRGHRGEGLRGEAVGHLRARLGAGVIR